MSEKPAQTKAEDLATLFQTTAQAFTTLIEGLAPTQWQTTVPGEERTVAALARHVAWGFGFEMEAFTAFVNGTPYETVTSNRLDTTNAQHAAEYANCPLPETLAYLRSEAFTAATTIRTFTNADLRKRGHFLEQFPPMNIERYIKYILVGHIQLHEQSIKEALGLT